MPGKLLQQFHEHWSRYCIRQGKSAADGAICLLAVSGGADSMVMADLFLKSRIPCAIAHCNYGLRGEASDLDEQLVHDWCKAHNIPFHSTKFDTKQKALEWKKGIQETARILRYEWFEQIRKGNHYTKIVTAHHANDNVETLLINLFKGTGISGLHGILPEQGHIIRPLLFAGREMITAYAHENKVSYREDASNATDDYLRNAVRHNIVPAVKQLFPNAVTNVNESISRFAETEILYRKAIEHERKQLLQQRGQDYYIPVLKLRHHEPLATIIYELLVPFGFTSAQVPNVLDLLQAESGHYILSATHRVIRNRSFLVVTTLPATTADLIIIESAPCTIDTGKYSFSFSIQDKPKVIPSNKDEAIIDLKEIEFPLMLRKWRTGDYLYPLGMKMKKKKVSRLLVDEKIPLHGKEDIRILACNNRVAWVSGIRLDERFKVKDSTEKVLVVKRQLL
ncbi:MAG: tRNA lysidine(34) synthetase TilS [Chitinophagales bacterium]